jgi:hypothetical protein
MGNGALSTSARAGQAANRHKAAAATKIPPTFALLILLISNGSIQRIAEISFLTA